MNRTTLLRFVLSLAACCLAPASFAEPEPRDCPLQLVSQGWLLEAELRASVGAGGNLDHGILSLATSRCREPWPIPGTALAAGVRAKSLGWDQAHERVLFQCLQCTDSVRWLDWTNQFGQGVGCVVAPDFVTVEGGGREFGGTTGIRFPHTLPSGSILSGSVTSRPYEGGRRSKAGLEKLGKLRWTLAGQSIPAREGEVFSVQLPDGEASALVALRLEDSKGKVIGAVDLPLSPRVPSEGSWSIPRVIQQGRTFQLDGPSDGDSRNTKVTLGGREVALLVESLGTVVAQAPTDVSGTVALRLEEAGEVGAEGEVRVLELSLFADDLDLKRGQRTRAGLRVTGLEGIDAPVPVQLINESPAVVRLEGGNRQEITIEPEAVSEGGFTWVGALEGIVPGSFSLKATIPALYPCSDFAFCKDLSDVKTPYRDCFGGLGVVRQSRPGCLAQCWCEGPPEDPLW